MEVELDTEKIPILQDFVSHLTQTMHSSSPGSEVIWYDSVTVDGELYWQNQLNEKNKAFFDRCDGIFVNYSWEEDYAKLSGEVAGERRYDVYMGIDVFGRGTFGGGQWNEPSYSGGGNVAFRGNLGANAEFTARLFQADLLLGKSPLYLTYSVNSSGNSLLGLVLEFSSPTTQKNSLFLADSRSTTQISSQFKNVIMPHRIKNWVDGWTIQECSIQMRGRTLKGIHALCYRANQNPSISSEYYALLGDIKISSSRET